MDEKNFKDLALFDDDFIAADVEERDFESVADGKYQVKIDSLELTRSEMAGKLMLKWTLKILGPKLQGTPLWRYSLISTKENVKWLKKDLHTCGMKIDKISDLPEKLDTIIGVGLNITKRTKNGYENIYINSRISLSDEYLEPSHSGNDVVKDEKFDLQSFDNDSDDMIPF